MKLEINPNESIGPFKLGASRLDILSKFSEYHSSSEGDIELFFDSAIQLEFENEYLDFIGVAFSPAYDVIFKGVNVFELGSVELFELISSFESGLHDYSPNEYCFPEQVLTLWDADEQYDYLGNFTEKVWGQIGLGSKRYWQQWNGA